MVHPVYLPLTNENIDRLFNQELFISAKDLIYWSTVVHKQLHKQGIYLDLDPSIELPEIISTEPRIKFKVFPMGKDYILEGKLVYPSPYLEEGGKLEIPLSTIRFQAPLIRSDYISEEETGNAWFYIPPHIFAIVS